MMAEDVFETDRFREKFVLSSDEYRVYFDAVKGDSSQTTTLHYGLTPTEARELAYKILAAAEASERKKQEKK